MRNRNSLGELAGGEFFSGADFFPDDARAVFRD